MLSWWRSRADDQSPKSLTKSPTKSPTKGERGSKGSSKAAISFSTDASTLSPTSSSQKPSVSSSTKPTDTSKKGSYNLPPPEKVPTLSSKDFVIVLVEIFMAYTSYVIRRRKSEAHAYHSQLWKTRREIEVDLLFMQGWAAVGSLLTGVLADGYIGNFYVALTSIVIIFLMATCLYLEQILIMRLNRNPYSEVFTEVASVAHLFSHSTGFSRVVFGLENMRNKKPSSISLLLFLFTLTGDVPSSGGVLMMVAGSASMSTLSIVRMSWWVSMVSVVLFVTVFKSIATEKSYRSASRRAVKCVLDGFWHMCTDRCVKRDWKDHVYRHYDKLTLTRAKGLVNYLILLLPIAGYIFLITGKFENLYSRIPQLLTTTGLHYYVGLSFAWTASVLLVMLVTYFLLMPASTWCGIPKKFNYHFTLGYFFALCDLYYVALVLKSNEKYNYDGSIAYIRIYNARDENVMLIPQDTSMTHLNLTIPPHSAVMGTYVINDAQMLLTMVKFDEVTNFTTFMKAEPKKCICYAIVEPPEMIKVTDDVPIFEGPLQTNDYEKPRIYLFNAARAFGKRTISFRDLTTGQWIFKLVSLLGMTDVFQVPPGKYEVWVEGTDLHLYKKFKDGGLYGIMLLSDITNSLLELDEVVPGKELPSTVFTGLAIFHGMALTLAYVPLRAMTYTKAPSGLLNTSFGVLSAQENLAVWVLVVGYNTWHKQILGDTLLTYSIVLTVFFFMSVFIIIKYNQFYAYPAHFTVD